MAELSTSIPTRVSALQLMVGARLRGQAQYRGSLLTDGFSQFMLALTEFVELYVLLHNAPVFGGMTLAQAAVVYGIGMLAFGLTDMVFGQLDQMSQRIKTGRLEVLLVRPTSLMLQLVTEDVQLRRLGRALFGLVACVIALSVSGIEWTPAKAALAVMAPVSGFLIFGALFVFAGALQFFVLDSNQAANAVTYGGNYVASMPAGALLAPVRVFFTFVVPATLIAYAPAAALTGAPLPRFMSPWMSWAGLPVAAAFWALVLLMWRAGLRRYEGAGG